MLDAYGRSIDYLRISVTDRCNLRCVYCMPPGGVPLLPHEAILDFERIVAVIRAAAELGFRKFRFTGGEPLVRRAFPALVGMARSVLDRGEILAMTTNGTLLAPLAEELRRRGLDSVNISLDTLDPDHYAAITRGGVLADALEGIDAAIRAGLAVKLNMVVGEETGDEEVAAIKSFAEKRGAALQRIRRYRLDEPKIDDDEFERPPRCASCNRIRLSADGRLRPCLYGAQSVAVDFSDIAASIEACVGEKPPRGLVSEFTAVSEIGG